jgi:multidrug efflux pump subunit AcrB
VARELQVELAKLDDIGLSYIVGEQTEEIRIEPDPEKLSLYGITLQQLAGKVAGANRSFEAGQVRENGRQISLMAGQTLQSPSDIGNILLTARDGRPVYVRDVAGIHLRARQRRNACLLGPQDGDRHRVRSVRVAGHRQAPRHQCRGHRRTHH